MSSPAEQSSTSTRDIVIERVLTAPRSLVWKAWTDLVHVTSWWGPRGFSTTTHERSFNPGGQWRFTMHGPDGRDYKNLVTYLEIVPERRLVYKHGGGEPGLEPVDFTAEVVFEEVPNDANSTRLTLRMMFSTEADRQRVIDEYGADDGAVETFARFAEHLGAHAGGDWSASTSVMLPTESSLMLSRVYAAPIDLLWRAWTEPEMISSWFCPKECKFLSGAGDVRVGGDYRSSMLCNGKVWTVAGRYLQVEFRSLLAFTHRWQEPAAVETVVRVRFITLDAARTEIRLAQTGLASKGSAIGHSEGWASCLENLADRLTEIRSIAARSADAQAHPARDANPAGSELDLVIERVFDAPLTLVWKAWTDPAHIARWWGPKGFSTRVEALDFRVGGRSRYVMIGPDGAEYPAEGTFLEIVPFKKIVSTDEFGADFKPPETKQLPSGMIMTVTFEALGTKTKLRICVQHPTLEDLRRHEEMGARAGWESSLDCLDELISALADA